MGNHEVVASPINPNFFPPPPEVLRSVMASTGAQAEQKQAALGKHEEGDVYKPEQEQVGIDSQDQHVAAPPQQAKPEQPQKQQLTKEDEQRLLELGLDLNDDLNPEQLAAARRVLQEQKDKLEKNPKLKHGPEAEQAVRPELAPVPTEGILDICEPDKSDVLLDE